MKKHATLRMILLAVVVTLAIGMTTTVFATEQETGQAEATATEQIENEISIGRSLPEGEELLNDFMLSQAGQELGETPTKKNPRGSKLTGQSAVVYGILQKEIRKIANGERAETIIKIPVGKIIDQLSYNAEELGVDELIVYDENQGKYCVAPDANEALVAKVGINDTNAKLIVHALLADSPYDLYWYDKTNDEFCGYETNVSIQGNANELEIQSESYVRFNFCTSSDYAQYSSEYEYNPYMVDVNKTALPKQAAQTAAGIVEDVDENETDYNRLETYKKEICKRVTYNSAAADEEEAVPYGDPWQLVYVFDDNENTNVVCEGYSKAYKFLFDITDQNDLFDNKDLDCYLVTGPMSYEYDGKTEGGPHMWNLLTMEDDENYLVDVTNCDVNGNDPQVVCTSDYFLKGDPNGNASGYTVEGLTYAYDEDTNAIYETAELTIAKADYDPGTDPGTGPGTDPGTDPGTGPGTDPGTDPGGDDPEPVVQSIEKAMVAGITNRTYSGGAQTQPLVVKLDGATLTAGKDYEVAYANNTNVGRATVTITGIGAYEGKLVRTFDINPQGTTIKSLKKAKKKFTVKWNKQANQTSGYQIQYCLKSNFKSESRP